MFAFGKKTAAAMLLLAALNSGCAAPDAKADTVTFASVKVTDHFSVSVPAGWEASRLGDSHEAISVRLSSEEGTASVQIDYTPYPITPISFEEAAAEAEETLSVAYGATRAGDVEIAGIKMSRMENGETVFLYGVHRGNPCTIAIEADPQLEAQIAAILESIAFK